MSTGEKDPTGTTSRGSKDITRSSKHQPNDNARPPCNNYSNKSTSPETEMRSQTDGDEASRGTNLKDQSTNDAVRHHRSVKDDEATIMLHREDYKEQLELMSSNATPANRGVSATEPKKRHSAPDRSPHAIRRQATGLPGASKTHVREGRKPPRRLHRKDTGLPPGGLKSVDVPKQDGKTPKRVDDMRTPERDPVSSPVSKGPLSRAVTFSDEVTTIPKSTKSQRRATHPSCTVKTKSALKRSPRSQSNALPPAVVQAAAAAQPVTRPKSHSLPDHRVLKIESEKRSRKDSDTWMQTKSIVQPTVDKTLAYNHRLCVACVYVFSYATMWALIAATVFYYLVALTLMTSQLQGIVLSFVCFNLSLDIL